MFTVNKRCAAMNLDVFFSDIDVSFLDIVLSWLKKTSCYRGTT